MKGLVEHSDSNNVFLVVKHNSIVQDSKTQKDGFAPVEVKNPRTGETVTKFIKRYDSVEGIVYKIEWYDTEERYEQRYFGWKIYIDAAGVPCVLDLPFDSRPSNRFMKVAENLDFSEPVEFRAWYDNKSESTAFYIGQYGKSVPQVYTRENPGDCPAPTQNSVSKKWNFEKQKEFLHGRMVDVVIPAVKECENEPPNGEIREEVTGAMATAGDGSHMESDDDIPF